MKKLMIAFTVIAGLALIPEFLQGAKINAVKVGSKINVTIDNKFFTSYVFSPDEKYPFLFPVNGPLSGSSVTSMRNSTYPHHASIFLACDRVNGGNYWYEGLDCGSIISVNAQILKEGGDTVVIIDECIWSRPGALSSFKDTRKITITANSPFIYQIDFEITLIALNDIIIEKTGHSLFSARVASDLAVQHGGSMINAEGEINEKGTWSKKSAWIDYYGKRGNIIEGLTIMQHPSNPWYPSPWFSRDYGFFAPGPMNWPENDKNISIDKGEKLQFKFRVLVHAGDYNEAKIANAFRDFVNLK